MIQMLEKDVDIMSNITDATHYVYTLSTLFLFLAILFDRSINRFLLKSLNLCFLISTQSIPLKFTGMIEWAIENLHTIFQIILRRFIFGLKSLNFASIIP